MSSGTLSKLNTTVLSGFKIGLTAQRGLGRNSANLFVGQGKFLSRNSGFSLSSAYSTTFLPKTNNFSLNHSLKGRLMAASSSKPVFGEVYVDDLITSSGNSLDLVKPTGVFFGDTSRSSCKKASVNFRRKELLSIKLTTGVLVSNVTPRTCNSNPIVGPWLGFMSPRISPFMCYSAGAAHDVSFDGHSHDEDPAESAILSDQSLLGGRTLKLLSGSCYLPHPDKEVTGGEDAHFICEDEQAIGVADGVGGWADVGVNAGLFARELMSYSVSAIKQEPKGSLDPARVLEKAHSSTKAKGSSTACIIALSEKGLHAINLGDSGFIVVREGCTIFRSPVQQHDFNFTYQLESGTRGDLPSSGQVFAIHVVPGDIVIAGTDGLFDNLYNNEVTAIVVQAVRAGMEPQLTAQKIAALARERALDRNRQTPFSTAAQEAGLRYYGGKLDDITVVVSYVSSSVDA